MKFDIYCDESRPEALGSKKPAAPDTLVIGSLWLPTEDRQGLKNAIHALRDKHKVGGEFKWQKVTPSRLPFYEELVNLFFAQGDRMRFRCIAVSRKKIDLLTYHDNDQELGFYKFYYQLLHRTASAIIEAKRFNASLAVMLVHSFSPENRWYEEAYKPFLELFGTSAQLNRLMLLGQPDGIPLYSGWVEGDKRFLSARPL